jgi:hypothetical protein
VIIRKKGYRRRRRRTRRRTRLSSPSLLIN